MGIRRTVLTFRFLLENSSLNPGVWNGREPAVRVNYGLDVYSVEVRC